MQGRTLGAYQVERELGAGGMGTVFLATVVGRAPGLPEGSQVALKVIHPHLLSSAGFFKRFLRESEIGKAVHHRNVVRCYDCDSLLVDEKRHDFLVMEYVEGQTLRALREELETVPEELCRHIGREAARGLSAIHEAGVVHRDLKPENVLITPDHEVKIMDLGVARLADEALRLSMSGAFVGSPLYASPEHFRGVGKDLDGRADLFSLGVILYELSCGAHPHSGADFAEVMARALKEEPRRLGERNPQLSSFFEELVHCLLEKNREDRISTATKLNEVLTDGEDSTWWGRWAQNLRAQTKLPLRRIRIPRDTSVYGREAEVATLRSLYNGAREGVGRVVLIEGEAGIGKTRLVDELIGCLHQDGETVNFLFGSYPPGGAATAAGAWSTAYREHFGAAALEETLESYLAVTPVLIPAFAALLRGEPAPAGTESLNKDSIQTVFVHATRALAAERTTIILIEDLHFAPEEGRALFASLALAVPDHRILLIGTARPGIPDRWRANLERLDHSSRMELLRLGPKDLAHLLKDAFQSERLARELGVQIGEKSDGNPFFVFEIIRGLREGRFITRRPDGTWVTTRVIEDIQIPSSVQDLIKARIADLTDEEQELLDVAACCGFEFDPHLAAEVVGLNPIPVLRRLGHLERVHRLLRSTGKQYVFDHHQVQETLYEQLAEPLREIYHRGIAETLESRHAKPDGAAAVDVCEHYLRAGQVAPCLKHLDAALDHLEKGYLADQEITLIDRALSSTSDFTPERRTELLLRKAARADLLGRRKVQGEAVEEALGLACEGELFMHARHVHGTYLLALSRHEEARAEFEEVRELARSHGEKKREADLTGSMGLVHWSLGRHEKARECFEQHLAFARERDDRVGEMKAIGNLGLVASELGEYAEAFKLNERCLELASELEDRRCEGTVVGNQGLVLWNLGRYEEAKSRHERCMENARAIGDRRTEALATGNVGLVLWSLGRLEEAIEQYDRQLVIAREIAERRIEATASENKGLAYLGMGLTGEAEEHFERQLALVREIGARRGEGRANGNLGGLFRSLGRYEDALRHYEIHLRIAVETGDRRGEAISHKNLGNLLIGLGDAERTETHLEKALVLSREIGARDCEGNTLLGLGYAASQGGDHDAATRHMEAALEVRRALGQEGGVSSALYELAILRAEAGDTEAAKPLFDEALRLSAASSHASVSLLPSLGRAVYCGDTPPPVTELLENEPRLFLATRMQCRYWLYRVTGKKEHLVEARKHLEFLRAHAPEAYRETMVESVSIYRKILAAAEGK